MFDNVGNPIDGWAILNERQSTRDCFFASMFGNAEEEKKLDKKVVPL